MSVEITDVVAKLIGWFVSFAGLVAVILVDIRWRDAAMAARGETNLQSRKLWPYLVPGLIAGSLVLPFYFGVTRKSAKGFFIGLGWTILVFVATVICATAVPAIIGLAMPDSGTAAVKEPTTASPTPHVANKAPTEKQKEPAVTTRVDEFARDLKGQLDRIEAETKARRSETFELTGGDLSSAFKIDGCAEEGRLPKLGIEGRYLCETDVLAVVRAAEKVTVRIRYAELLKEAENYAGLPVVISGRVQNIVELPPDPTTQGLTVAQIYAGCCDPTTWIYVVAGRFQTHLARGSSVEVVGFLAGKSTLSMTGAPLPAIAAVAIGKPGGVAKLKTAYHAKRGQSAR